MSDEIDDETEVELAIRLVQLMRNSGAKRWETVIVMAKREFPDVSHDQIRACMKKIARQMLS